MSSPASRPSRRPLLPSWLPVDPYILALLGTVGLAALLPASGTAATVAEGASKAAVALLFFLYGARLSTREALDGLTHWRLHVTVLACTFVLFPLLGLAARGLVPAVLTPSLYGGLLFLCLVPSTVQSSIAFTSIARGNVPAAICAGSFSSLAGIVLTPLLAAALLGNGAGGFSSDSLVEIVLQLLVPFLAGQLLRRWVGGFLVRHKRVLGYVDRGSILLVVYTAFSAGMTQGVWRLVTPARLGLLLAVEAALLALMLSLSWYGAETARLRAGGPDRDPVRRIQEEPGGRTPHGERPVRRPGRARGAAAHALPPDAADGLRGDRQTAVAGSGGGDHRPRHAPPGPGLRWRDHIPGRPAMIIGAATVLPCPHSIPAAPRSSSST
ncbi:hypothetical protein GCM10019017_16310 [Streptomyces showdoensis]